MEYAEYNEDNGRNEFGVEFDRKASQAAALQSLLLDNGIKVEESTPIRESKTVKEFLDMPVNDKREANLKKLYAAAVVVAKDKKVLPFETPDTSVGVASAVDDGLTRMKVGYQTATGELDILEATDILIDRAAARTVAVVDKIIEKGVPFVADMLYKAVSCVFPPAKVVAPIVEKAVRYVTPRIKNFVRKGIKTVAEAAKPIVRNVVKAGKKVLSKVGNVLKALFS